MAVAFRPTDLRSKPVDEAIIPLPLRVWSVPDLLQSCMKADLAIWGYSHATDDTSRHEDVLHLEVVGDQLVGSIEVGVSRSGAEANR